MMSANNSTLCSAIDKTITVAPIAAHRGHNADEDVVAVVVVVVVDDDDDNDDSGTTQ